MLRTIPPDPPDRESQTAPTARESPGPAASRLAADLLALIYIGIIATVATVTGAFYLMFPELAALSWNVMEHPRGRWASSPILLAFTPALTGLVGTVATRTMPYGFPSVLITVITCIAVVRALRSPVAPAISAGLLPLVLGVTSWWYPPGILFGSSLLAAISIAWRSYTTPAPFSDPAPGSNRDLSAASPSVAPSNDAASAASAEPAIVAPPSMRGMLALLTFVAIAVGAVTLTGMRFILFPPLVVILYEMLCHPGHCHWIGRPIGLPLACFLAAAGGYFFRVHIAFGPLAAMLSMAWGVTVLRTLDLHVPPALAVALLPMVMTNPTVAFPLAVGIGTTLASAWFALFEKLLDSGPDAAAASARTTSTPDTAI